MGISRLVVMGVALAAFTSCSGEPPATRPADPYASLEELAEALREAELCEEFVDKSHRTKTFEFGTCWPPGADRGSADFVLLSRYPDESEYEKHRRWDSTGCNGPMVYGPNWSVGPVGRDEAEVIIEGLGGEPVGSAEQGDC